MINITTYVLGPLENNVYLVEDPVSKSAVVIDPGFDAYKLNTEIRQRDLALTAVWITHAHFDHFAGVPGLLREHPQHVPIGLHPFDLPLWKMRGGADHFGARLEPMPEPDLTFQHGQQLWIGKEIVEVRHAPGHSAGHVMFYIPSAGALICGDVIFMGSIGRTDLAEGDYETLISSINFQVLTLPENTRLLPGHGPETTVGEEQATNPFLIN